MIVSIPVYWANRLLGEHRFKTWSARSQFADTGVMRSVFSGAVDNRRRYFDRPIVVDRVVGQDSDIADINGATAPGFRKISYLKSNNAFGRFLVHQMY